jgi:hypothetical protein
LHSVADEIEIKKLFGILNEQECIIEDMREVFGNIIKNLKPEKF